MEKGLVAFLALSVSANAFAASQQMIWGNDSNQTIPKLKSATKVQTFTKQAHASAQSDYQLEPVKSKDKQNNHTRYQITYKGLPVWGHQLVFHKKNAQSKPEITGINVSGIEHDVTSIQAKLSPEQAENLILAKLTTPVKYKKIKKVIFIDGNEKAYLAYHLSFFINKPEKPISAPNYMLDANTGEVLKEWNEARSEKIGQGLGGNSITLPYRAGMYQYGSALPNLPSLGKFDVQAKDGFCHVENENFMVVSLMNYPLGYDAFPINVLAEKKIHLSAFSYPCGPESLYLNYADGMSGPMNYSFSPINDAMYFAEKTVEMYQTVYGVQKPLGDDLPVRTYTHLGEMDNAFAISTIEHDGFILAHQQVVVGNGDKFLTAPTQSVLAHELSHNFTALNSGLFYEGQAGAINEAFSDMAAIALQDYIRQEFPWYWDGKDWALGREAVLDGEPIRYMDDPTQDGYSIGHSADYTDDVDVHNSSGVFNKAFYLLANKPDWSIQKAFQVMVDANQYYWSPIAYFDFAACGVIEAAIDNKYDKDAVIEAFDEVGVQCPMHKKLG